VWFSLATARDCHDESFRLWLGKWKDWIGFSGCHHVGHLEGPCVRDPGSHCVHCDAPLCFEHAAIDRDLKRFQSKCHMHSLTDVNCPCPGCRDPGLESFVAKVEVPPPVSHTPALLHTTPRKPKSKRLVNLQSIPENDSVMKIRSKFRPCRQGKASAEESFRCTIACAVCWMQGSWTVFHSVKESSNLLNCQERMAWWAVSPVSLKLYTSALG